MRGPILTLLRTDIIILRNQIWQISLPILYSNGTLLVGHLILIILAITTNLFWHVFRRQIEAWAIFECFIGVLVLIWNRGFWMWIQFKWRRTLLRLLKIFFTYYRGGSLSYLRLFQTMHAIFLSFSILRILKILRLNIALFYHSCRNLAFFDVWHIFIEILIFFSWVLVFEYKTTITNFVWAINLIDFWSLIEHRIKFII